MIPTYADVIAASDRIRPHIHRTPVVTSRFIDQRARAEVFAKGEHLQKVGAFKARGALNAVLSLDAGARRRGVVTHSSGNHGQALAYAASVAGTSAIVVMPDHAPAVKVDAVRGYGADVVFCRQEERQETLERIASSSGRVVVHPFDDPLIVAGQGTATEELIEDVPGLDIVITPIGGGGLLSGSTLAASHHGVATIGAEPEVVDDAARSLRDGVRHPATGRLSVGDGLLVGIGEIPFRILSDAGTRIVTVSEEEILEAMRFVVSRTKQVIEPSAATVFAVLFKHDEELVDRRVGAIISGGNMDLDRLA